MAIEDRYEEIEEKLEKVCTENMLTVYYNRQYPFIFKFQPICEETEQVKLDGFDPERSGEIKPSDPQGAIEIIFGDELVIQITKGITIDDGLLNRLKSMSKRIHYLYLQIWFKNTNHGQQKLLPSITATRPEQSEYQEDQEDPEPEGDVWEPNNVFQVDFEEGSQNESHDGQ